MTELNTQNQIVELTDEQIESIEGGGHASAAPAKLLGFATRLAIDILLNRHNR